MANNFAKKNIITVNINYSLVPHVIHPNKKTK